MSTVAWPPLLGLLVWLAALGLRRADLGREALLAESVGPVIPLIVAPLALAASVLGDRSKKTAR